MIRVEIWASGSGTNADAILEYFKDNSSIQIVSIGCNKKEAGAFTVAKKHGINSHYWSKEDWNAKNILISLKSRSIDFIILAGFLKLVPQEVTSKFAGRIVNIHPSLLPKYGGKNMFGENVHRAVLAANEACSGITIHEVNEKFDEGKILAQYAFKIEPNTSLQNLKSMIQITEHQNFAPTIEAWIKSKS